VGSPDSRSTGSPNPVGSHRKVSFPLQIDSITDPRKWFQLCHFSSRKLLQYMPLFIKEMTSIKKTTSCLKHPTLWSWTVQKS